jgi:hypothetical protein
MAAQTSLEMRPPALFLSIFTRPIIYLFIYHLFREPFHELGRIQKFGLRRLGTVFVRAQGAIELMDI